MKMLALFSNTTVLPKTQWHPEPQFRGTFAIFSSCIITLSLSIWTSLHIHLPKQEEKYLQKYRKAGWMVLGLLVPELLVWNAWEQRKRAKRLNTLMEENGFITKSLKTWKRIRKPLMIAWRKTQVSLGLEAESQSNPSDLGLGEHYNGRVHAWTGIHSWFVVMGGLAFEDTAPEDQQFMPKDSRRIHITQGLFTWIVRNKPHLIPDISRDRIEDNSKSDGLAKALACWQAGYFCIQCIFRLSERLSITLLELNVFGHAICALLLFLIWWNKPHDVGEPIVILGEEALDVCAYHSFHPDLYLLGDCDDDTPYLGHGFRFSAMRPPLLPGECLVTENPITFRVVRPSDRPEMIPSIIHHDSRRYRYLKVRSSYWRIEMGLMSLGLWEEDNVSLENRDIERLVRSYRLIMEDLTLRREIYVRTGSKCNAISDWKLRSDDTLDCCTQGPPKDPQHARVGWLTAGMTLAGAFYGGLHLVGWTYTFPSQTETLLWRTASVTIVATGPFLALITMCVAGLTSLFRRLKLPSLVLRVCNVTWVILLPVLLLWYTLCRTFIVIESFILLAHIPASALQVPTWSVYIPKFA